MSADRPVDNAPYLTHVHAGLTIEGWSRAAVQSYWRVPELKVGFDLGAQPWDFMGTPTWFVTHTHLDHIAALCEVMRHLIFVQQAGIEEQRECFHRFLYSGGVRLCDAITESGEADFYKAVARLAKSFFELEHTAFEML